MAGFVSKPLLCQTCARASAAAAAAAPPLRCVSALTERRTERRGEGREAEETSGVTKTHLGDSTDSERIKPTHRHPVCPSFTFTRQEATCAARARAFRHGDRAKEQALKCAIYREIRRQRARVSVCEKVAIPFIFCG